MCVCEMTDVRLEEAVTVCVYVPLLTMMTTTERNSGTMDTNMGGRSRGRRGRNGLCGKP